MMLMYMSVVIVLISLKCSEGNTVVKTKTIVNVGGTGEYEEIVGMPCDNGNDMCMRASRPVSGCLAPFDEEQTLKLRGPMEISKIGVYYPSGGSWSRKSYFDRMTSTMENMVFMGNYGRAEDGKSVDEGSCHYNPGGTAKIVVNNDDFMCHGYNTSYVSSDGKCASVSPTMFNGILDDTVEVNIMQGEKCLSNECGYFRGVGHKGWSGSADGSKLFAIQVL